MGSSITKGTGLPLKAVFFRTSATRMPTTTLGTPKAVNMASLMELDCTMLPIKPRARMMATEKKPARNLPKPLGKAALM